MISEKAGVAQLVEYKLPKLGVGGSNPLTRSNLFTFSSPNIVTPNRTRYLNLLAL